MAARDTSAKGRRGAGVAGVSKAGTVLVNAEKPKPGRGGPRPNSGRKSKAEEMGLMALLDKCWTVADREACVVALARKAKCGDMEATKLLFNYAFGRPKEHKEVSGSRTIRVIYEDQPIEAGGAT
jgi:hypothetical protein